MVNKRRIQHDISPARNHERNGLAERNIRTIQDRIRVIGNASSAPKSLWGEAGHYAAYTQNRVPCSSNPATTPAMQEELESFKRYGVYKIVAKPEGEKILSTQWVFTQKRDEEREVKR
jgi:hypothetical protein